MEGQSRPSVVSTSDSTKVPQSTEGDGIVLEPMDLDHMIEVMDDENDTARAPPTEVDSKPVFKPHDQQEMKKLRNQIRRILVPKHRLSPLKSNWKELITPLVTQMHLQVRMNLRKKAIEIRMGTKTEDINYLQKAADYCKAFMLGFELQDAIALLRLDDLFIQSFEVKDVKRLNGDHLARCIGRLAGKDGKTKYAIENTTRTRIVIADTKIHILGSFTNIRLARDSVCNLILGSQPNKVYNRLKTVSRRLQERI